MTKDRIIPVVAIIALGIAIFGLFTPTGKNLVKEAGQTFGAAGNMLAENYMPYIMYNGGYKSDKPIDTTSTLDADGATTLGATLVVTGTSTIPVSYDGHIVWDDFTSATGTAKAVYTNNYGPMECNDAYIYAKNTGFVPGLSFTLGSTTSATGYSANLIASTTVGTSTTQLIASLSSVFILGSGESIVGAIQQAYADASSTHLGNMSAQFGVRCNLIGA